MIKKFIDQADGQSPKSNKPHFGRRTEVPASVHGIDPHLVDERAVNVTCVHLQQAGLRPTSWAVRCATCCWACVPKTSMWRPTPRRSRSKGLFRRAFIIGRRFPHRACGAWPWARQRGDRGLDFRAHLDNAAAEQVKGNERTSKRQLEGMQHAVDSTGRVLRDNVWGPQDEDATRRDFTVNAMYYDPADTDRGGLPRRYSGCQEARAAHDRRPGCPVPRRPSAHHPCCAFCRQAQPPGFQAGDQNRQTSDAVGQLCWPTCRKAACLTKCSSSCKPDMRWRPSSSSKSWAWPRAFTPCSMWWWSGPTVLL
jgi:poly(A) polymerase